jgi:hypothetical protein
MKLATRVARDFAIDPDTLLRIAHYPVRVPGMRDSLGREHFSRVDFDSDHRTGAFRRPAWRHLSGECSSAFLPRTTAAAAVILPTSTPSDLDGHLPGAGRAPARSRSNRT